MFLHMKQRICLTSFPRRAFSKPKIDVAHVKRRSDAIKANQLIEFKGTTKDDLKNLLYSGSKPWLILLTGPSLTHPSIYSVEKFAFQNLGIMNLLELK